MITSIIDKFIDYFNLDFWTLWGLIAQGFFFRTFEDTLCLSLQEEISNICEIGCGERELLKIVHSHFPAASLHATDISSEEIEKARHNCAGT
jgi:methylase of polypeptide subunit release factors